MSETRPEAPGSLTTVESSVETCLCPMACSVYVEIGDAFTCSKASPDQTCPGWSLGKKVFEVNRKITHGRDVLYWPGRALIVLQIFFSSFLFLFSLQFWDERLGQGAGGGERWW